VLFSVRSVRFPCKREVKGKSYQGEVFYTENDLLEASKIVLNFYQVETGNLQYGCYVIVPPDVVATSQDCLFLPAIISRNIFQLGRSKHDDVSLHQTI
jgi:hypothetical protein